MFIPDPAFDPGVVLTNEQHERAMMAICVTALFTTTCLLVGFGLSFGFVLFFMSISMALMFWFMYPHKDDPDFSRSCPSPTLARFCRHFRQDGLQMIHLQTADLMHPGYLIRKGINHQNPGELELIEVLVLGFNGLYASRTKVQDYLSRRFHNFDLVKFEQCLSEFLRVEQGLRDGSIKFEEVTFDDATPRI